MNIAKLRVSVLVFIFLIAITARSFASQWVLVTANDDVRVFVDMQSLQINREDVKVWEKWIFDRHKETKSTSPKKKYYTARILFKYHCDEGTAHILEFIQDGSSIAEDYFKYPETHDYRIEPERDSIMATVFESVCHLRKAPKQ
jgi:hypothetical protein